MRGLLLLTTFSSLYAFQASRTPEKTLMGLSHSFEQLVNQVTPAVVQISSNGLAPEQDSRSITFRTQQSSGSGVIVDPDGYIVTNAHVVGLTKRVQVLLPLSSQDGAAFRSVIKPPGKLATAEVIGFDRETDIAVLKLESEKGLQALRFADSEALKQGQLALAFGSPFGLDNSVTMGVISSAARQIRPDHPMIYIQTDASINPGNSGGPLVDADGAIVGINTFILSSSGSNAGVGFAAPSNIVKAVYEQIRKNGRVKRGQIGVQAQTVTPELVKTLKLASDHGVLIADVTANSPAEAGGLEIKDVLLTLNGKRLENSRQFGVNIYQRAGETVTIELLRGSEKMTKQVAVLERPRDTEQLLSMVNRDTHLVSKLGVLALDLDEKVSPLLPQLRRLSGVVIAGAVTERGGRYDSFYPGDVIYAVNNTKISTRAELDAALQQVSQGDIVALQVERLGQLQFLIVDVQ